MSRVVLLFVALVCLLALESCAAVECDGDTCTAPVLKIGVVGAGIGGASVAHFLRRRLPMADIHVFERASVVGGRVRSTVIEGARIEQGASVYHISNRYFDSFVRDLNLKRKEPPNLGLWGIWNGAEFVIHESEWLLLTLTKMLYRYGLSPFKVENQAGLVKDRWVEVYSKLENTTFETSEALLESLNVTHFTQKSLLQALREGGVSEEYIHELVTAIERVNYGQDPAMNSFAGFVGLVGSGKETLFSVEGGNHLVVEGLLKAARTRIHLNTRVLAVTAVNKEGEDKTAYRLDYSRGGKKLNDTFDAVVLATPLEFTDIEFTLGDEHVPAGDLPAAAGKRRPYQQTHATLVVASELKRSFFGVPEGAWIPSFVLTTENPAIPFNSASAVRKLNETHNVYKVFSRQELADETLDRLFGGRGYTLRQPWAAYPVLTPYPFSEWPRIRLHDKLYYANAFESAVSCLETQIASAHNVANLLLGDLRSA